MRLALSAAVVDDYSSYVVRDGSSHSQTIDEPGNIRPIVTGWNDQCDRSVRIPWSPKDRQARRWPASRTDMDTFIERSLHHMGPHRLLMGCRNRLRIHGGL